MKFILKVIIEGIVSIVKLVVIIGAILYAVECGLFEYIINMF